jgi:hypothetical protein
LYSFISYNRRIIVPSKISLTQNFDCAPDFHLAWRMSLIVFCISFFYTIILGLNMQLNLVGVNLFLVYPILHIAFILWMTKDDWTMKLWNALGDFAVTNLSTTLLFLPLFLIDYFVLNLPNYYIIIVFVLFQIRLMIHFVMRIENKKYLS